MAKSGQMPSGMPRKGIPDQGMMKDVDRGTDKKVKVIRKGKPRKK